MKPTKKYTHEYITRDRIRIGMWRFHTPQCNEHDFKNIVDCGIDTIITGNATVNRATRETTLNLADKYGVETYVTERLLDYSKPWTQEQIDKFDPVAAISTYKHHPSFTGCFFNDEPGTDAFPWMSAILNKFEDQTGYKSLINMLPSYANAAQLKFGANASAIEYYDSDPNLFTKYCDSYCDYFKSNVLSTDIYPLNWDQYGRKFTYKDYIESINLSAEVARRRGRDFWCCIQTYGWIYSKRTPNEAEYRWQCYSVLSFGCNGILLWNYNGSPEFPSLVHIYTGEPTDAYYAIQPVLWEMQNLSDVYVQYKNLGAFTHNGDKVPYLHMSGEYKDFDVLTEIKSEEPLLIGCFEKKQGKGKAFTLVNMTEFQDNLPATVKFKTKAKKVTVYRKAEPTVLTANRGVYTIDLECGEGVFVTLD